MTTTAPLSLALARLAAQGPLAAGELEAAFAVIMDGNATHNDIQSFLVATTPLMKNATALAAGASALRARMLPLSAPPGAIDVCGTGGDGAHTLNISTAVAFVLAGCGVPVAKHGNRAMSSKTGAADVLEALGVRLTADRTTLERAIYEARIAFLFAQNHHPAMRHVAAARKALGRRTIFNLLGPLSNPASVDRQVLGVFDAEFAQPMAQALHLLGAQGAMVVHGHGGLDELSCEGENLIQELRGGHIQSAMMLAQNANIETFPNSAIKGGDAAYNAAALRALLSGSPTQAAYAGVVALNAAAALVMSNHAPSWAAASRRAKDSIASGAALQALEKLIAITNEAQDGS
jgi:anthranilate phosphoribosyltransferase